jgi:hypothetical protein
MKIPSLKRILCTAASGMPLATVLVSLPATQLSAAETQISFNRDIRPILAENCFHCHGPDPGTRKAGLRLDTEEGLFEKSKDEKKKNDPPAVIRGKVEDSEMYKRLVTRDKDEVMPPEDSHKQLKQAEIELLKKWIASGAPWQPHWALIPPVKVAAPGVKNGGWVKNPIDQFVLAKLEAKGLAPGAEASPREFFRRLHLDITGLPPHAADVDAFAREYAETREESLSRWIDRLMQSPTWGEHRARYWLDAARYSDTHGLHFDNFREMHLYRDWVIRAFNANQPFSDFTVEQIAGDLLPQPQESQLIATGFQRCAVTTNEGGTIAEENLAIYAAERVQTVGWVFLGLTMNCAQCHDHKFDPISAKDFYSMAAFFRNTTQGAFDGNIRDGKGPALVMPMAKDKARWAEIPQVIKTATAQRDERRMSAQPEFLKWVAGMEPDALAADLPTKELVAYAPLNDGAGNEPKLQFVKDGVIQANANLEWAPGGKLGPAPVIKADSAISLGDIGDFDANQPFSFGAWVKPVANKSGSILARMNADENLRGYDLIKEGKNYSVHLIDTWPGKAMKVITKNATAKEGTWQHVFVTYNGGGKPSGIKIFIDGKEEVLRVDKKDLQADSSIRTKTPFRVGQRSKGSVLEGTAIQDVRVYGRQLELSEVKLVASYPAVKAALAAGDKRTAPQKNALLEYYLSAHDTAFQEVEKTIALAERDKDAIKARSAVTLIQEEVQGKMPMANILDRGQYNKEGEVVEAEPPKVLHPLPAGAPKNRLGLAQWLVADNNPLTVRVTVNRFWQEVFGQGIVRSVEDFGVMGAEPSNQALLDWLSADFRENGWNVQRLFKQMLMSAAYRQSAVVSVEKTEKDRDNALLSRGPRFRMDAEMIRDYALATSGLMSSKMYGPGTRPYQPEGIWDVVGLPGADTRNYVQDKGENLYRRTVYNFHKRMAPSPNMETFNLTSREFSCVRRERTNTPLQALVTLNDIQFVEAARHLAQVALERSGGDQNKTLDYIGQRVLGRPFSEKESTVLLESGRDFLAFYQEKPDDAQSLVKVGESVASAKVPAPVLAAWTMVCNQVLNLDETLTK